MEACKAWKEVPEKVFGAPFKSGSISLELNPALLGVGYIIGPRIASIMCGGGVLAYLVLIPAIKFFGEGAAGFSRPVRCRSARWGRTIFAKLTFFTSARGRSRPAASSAWCAPCRSSGTG
jgi:uncharacterized oligopeptide transporter (OPT) family protein